MAAAPPRCGRSARPRRDRPDPTLISACTVGIAASATTATTPPSARGCTRAAAASQRRRVSSAGRSWRPNSAQVSSSSAAPYPSGARVRRRGRHHQRGPGGISACTESPAEVMTAMPGKPRTEFLGVRRAPITTARIASEPQRHLGRCRAPYTSGRPRRTASRSERASGPCGAGSGRWCGTARRRPTDVSAAGTWTSTGRSSSRAPRAPASATDGSRAVRAARPGRRRSRRRRGPHARRAGPHHRPGRHQIMRPAAADQRLRLPRCARSRRSGPRTAIGGRAASRPRGRAGRGPRFRQRVVAVVPRRSPGPAGRPGENRAAGADHHPRGRAARTASAGSGPTGPSPADSATTAASSMRAVTAARHARRRRAGRARWPAPYRPVTAAARGLGDPPAHRSPGSCLPDRGPPARPAVLRGIVHRAW